MSLIYLIAGIVFAVVAGSTAHAKGRNTLGWCVAGFLIGPFGLVVALLPAVARAGQLVECPSCFEVVQVDAQICRYCGFETKGRMESDMPVGDARQSTP